MIPRLPPLLTTEDGRPRRIGVEIEFAGLDCATAAAAVRDLYGGRPVAHGPYRIAIEDTALGDFLVELDARLAHPPEREDREDTGRGNELALALAAEIDDLKTQIERKMADVAGAVGGLILPVEVVCPPLVVERLIELERLRAELRRLGAQGTGESLLYAFGLQLNVEVARRDVGYLRDHLRAYMLLADWLKAEIALDLSRRIAPFIRPFPPAYVQMVLDPSYAPDLRRFVDDYIEANPSRNRELDLMPLFSELVPDHVRARFEDKLTKPRPTFHYRLPNSRIEDSGWRIATEWNRWLEVERLALQPERLAALARAYRTQLHAQSLSGWVEKVGAWLRA